LLLVTVMPISDDRNAAPPPQNDAGRSQERTQQDAVLERAARQESWLSRLWRSKRERKAKPAPSESRDRKD
jgi:hypothetical protein